MLAHIAPSGPNRRRPRKLAALPKFGRHTRAFADDRKAPAKVHAHSPDRADPPKAGKHRASQAWRSEEHTSELQSLMRNSYAVFCLKKKNKETTNTRTTSNVM